MHFKDRILIKSIIRLNSPYLGGGQINELFHNILISNDFYQSGNKYVKDLKGYEIHFSINENLAYAKQITKWEGENIFDLFESMPVRNEWELNYLIQHPCIIPPNSMGNSPTAF